MSKYIKNGFCYTNHGQKIWRKKFCELTVKSFILYEDASKKKKFFKITLKEISKVYTSTYPTFPDFGDFGFTVYAKDQNYINICALNLEEQKQWVEYLETSPKEMKKILSEKLKERGVKKKRKFSKIIPKFKIGKRGGRDRKSKDEDKTSEALKRKTRRTFKIKGLMPKLSTAYDLNLNLNSDDIIVGGRNYDKPKDDPSLSQSIQPRGLGEIKKNFKNIIRNSLPQRPRRKKSVIEVKISKPIQLNENLEENNAISQFSAISQEVKYRPVFEDDLTSPYFFTREQIEEYTHSREYHEKYSFITADRLRFNDKPSEPLDEKVVFSDQVTRYTGYATVFKKEKITIVITKSMWIVEGRDTSEMKDPNKKKISIYSKQRNEGLKWEKLFAIDTIKSLIMNCASLDKPEEQKFVSLMVNKSVVETTVVTYLFISLESKREFLRILKYKLGGLPRVHYVRNILFYSQHSHMLGSSDLENGEDAASKSGIKGSVLDYEKISQYPKLPFTLEEDKEILFSAKVMKLKSIDEIGGSKAGKDVVLVVTGHGVYMGRITNKRFVNMRTIVLKLISEFVFCKQEREKKVDEIGDLDDEEEVDDDDGKKEDNDDEVDPVEESKIGGGDGVSTPSSSYFTSDTPPITPLDESSVLLFDIEHIYIMLRVPVEGDLLIRFDDVKQGSELISLLQKIFSSFLSPRVRGSSVSVETKEFFSYQQMKSEYKNKFQKHTTKQSVKKENIDEKLRKALRKYNIIEIRYLIEKFPLKMSEEQLSKANAVVRDFEKSEKIKRDWNKHFLENSMIQALQILMASCIPLQKHYKPIKKWKNRREKKINSLRNIKMFIFFMYNNIEKQRWEELEDFITRANQFDELREIVSQFKFQIDKAIQRQSVLTTCIPQFIKERDLDGIRFITKNEKLFKSLPAQSQKEIREAVKEMTREDQEFKKLKQVIVEARKLQDETRVQENKLYLRLKQDERSASWRVIKEADEGIKFIEYYKTQLKEIERFVKLKNRRGIDNWMTKNSPFHYLFEHQFELSRQTLREIDAIQKVKKYKRRLNILFKQTPINRDLLEKTLDQIESENEEIIDNLRNQILKAKILLKNLDEKNNKVEDDEDEEDEDLDDDEEENEYEEGFGRHITSISRSLFSKKKKKNKTKKKKKEEESEEEEEEEVEGESDDDIDDDLEREEDDENLISKDSTSGGGGGRRKRYKVEEKPSLLSLVLEEPKGNNENIENEKDESEEEEDELVLLYNMKQKITLAKQSFRITELSKLLEEFSSHEEYKKYPSFYHFYKQSRDFLIYQQEQDRWKSDFDQLVRNMQTQQHPEEFLNNREKYRSTTSFYLEKVRAFQSDLEGKVSRELAQKAESIQILLEKEEKEIDGYISKLSEHLKMENLEALCQQLESLRKNYRHFATLRREELNNLVGKVEEVLAKKLKNRHQSLTNFFFRVSSFIRAGDLDVVTRESHEHVKEILRMITDILADGLLLFEKSIYGQKRKMLMKKRGYNELTIQLNLAKSLSKEETRRWELEQFGTIYRVFKGLGKIHASIGKSIEMFQTHELYRGDWDGRTKWIYYLEFLFDSHSMLHVIYPFLFFSKLERIYQNNLTSILIPKKNRVDFYEILQKLFPSDRIGYQLLLSRGLRRGIWYINDENLEGRSSSRGGGGHNVEKFLEGVRMTVSNIVKHFMERAPGGKKEGDENRYGLYLLVQNLCFMVFHLLRDNMWGLNQWKLLQHVKKISCSRNVKSRKSLMFIHSVHKIEAMFKKLEEEKKKKLEEEEGKKRTGGVKNIITILKSKMSFQQNEMDKRKFFSFIKFSLNKRVLGDHLELVFAHEGAIGDPLPLKSEQGVVTQVNVLKDKKNRALFINLVKKFKNIPFELVIVS